MLRNSISNRNHAPYASTITTLLQSISPAKRSAIDAAARRRAKAQAGTRNMVFCEKAGIEFDDELTFWDTPPLMCLGTATRAKKVMAVNIQVCSTLAAGQKACRTGRTSLEPKAHDAP